MRMQSKTLMAALALALPGLAFAAQPLTVNFGGHEMPMHETVQTLHTAAGPAQVKTWTWQSPQGNARVVIQQSEGGAAPAWALQHLQAMNAQFAQMQQTMAQMNAQMQSLFGPLSTLPVLLPQPQWALPPLLPVTVIAVPQLRVQGQHQMRHPALPAVSADSRLRV